MPQTPTASTMRMVTNVVNGTRAATAGIVVTDNGGGVPIIQPGTPLTRLNYYDGKFLRASDLDSEQQYFRELVSLSNQAGGPGVVYGFDVSASGDDLRLTAGLGIGPGGRVIYLPSDATVSIARLLGSSSQALSTVTPASGGSADFADCEIDTTTLKATVVNGTSYYLLTVCHAEGLCGEEDVYGKLCEEACVTSTDRPFRVEGVVVRATPLVIKAKPPAPKFMTLGAIHARSVIASMFFETERTGAHASMINGNALRSSGIWCVGATHEEGCGVPVGVLAQGGGTTWLDTWIARRERIDAPPRAYWSWKMMMRPWNVFLAQILQFQCQLHAVLPTSGDPGGGDDACSDHEVVLAKVQSYFTLLKSQLRPEQPILREAGTLLRGGLPALTELSASVDKALIKVARGTTDRVLINRGIVELPSAGYLPVTKDTNVSVNDQVRALLGDGLDLRFCIVDPDYVAHALETAQHMERISLLWGIDHPDEKPKVDILVPGGAVAAPTTSRDRIFAGTMHAATDNSGSLSFLGAGRTQALQGTSRAFHFAGIGHVGSAFSRLISSLGLMKTGEVPVGGLTKETIEAPVRFPTGFVDNMPKFQQAMEGLRLDFVNNTGPFEIGAEKVGNQKILTGYDAPAANIDGAWLTMRTDRPLSSLSAATPLANIAGRFVIGDVARGSLRGLEISTTGTASFAGERMTVDPADGTVTRTVQALLTITLAVSTIDETALAERKLLVTRRISAPISMAVTGDDSVGQVTTLFAGGQLRGCGVRTSWDSSAGTVVGRVFTPGKNRGDEAPLVSLELKDDSAVMDDANTTHQQATRGIDVVQSVLLTEDSFEHDALAALFAPLDTSGDFAITAVNDWVLFHRRRTAQCEAPPVRKPAEPPRSYRVFELTVAGRETAADWSKRAQSSNVDDQTAVAQRIEPPVELFVRGDVRAPALRLVVEFEGGLSKLRTSADEIATDWPSFRPGKSLAFGLIARPNADATIEAARLSVLEAAIPSASTDISKVTNIWPLSTVPDGWSDSSTDGSILLITETNDVECQHVFGSTDPDLVNAIPVDLSSAATAQDVINRLKANQLIDLGAVRFFVGGADTVDAQPFDAIKAKFPFGFSLPRVVSWVPNADVNEAAHKAQAAAIGKAVNGGDTGFVLSILKVNGADPITFKVGNNTCPAITILLGEVIVS